MTPERAEMLALEALSDINVDMTMPPSFIVRSAILAACAEQDKESRKAALTLAQELCERHVREQQANKPMDDRSHFYMVGAMDCAVAIKTEISRDPS